MPNIYKKCFIGLRLTNKDGNANSTQELKAMGIPVVHNLSKYGLKWNNINDIIFYINYYHNLLVKNNYNIFNNIKIDFNRNINLSKQVININNNINYFTLFLKLYNNILFISSRHDDTGKNCYNLLKFYKEDHNIKYIYLQFKKDNNQ